MESHQHAGPILATYSTGNPIVVASIHFAQRSFRLTIRTASHTQNAAKATSMIDRAVLMAGSYRRRENARR